MRLAVLTQTVGEGLNAPLLGLGDLAPHLFDDGLELGGQFFDLLRAGVLAREEDVFVEWHPMPFPCSLLHPARSPSSPFGKGSNAQKAGTRDAGPSALDRKSTRLNSSHLGISYAVFCLKKKKKQNQ